MRVLVCGDAMKDVYWLGAVNRLSPEAPVPILSVLETETRAGGAANVANNIESLGVQVERIFSQSPRIEKFRLHTDRQHLFRADFDYPQAPILPNTSFEEALSRCQIVVFIDYGKGSLSNIQDLITKSRGKIILVDPKGWDYAKYRGVSLIKPNRDEMKELVGGWSNQTELDFKARQFLLTSGIDSILLTQGSDGMTLYTKEKTLHEEAQNKIPLDVSGAGEAVLSTFAACLARGINGESCLKFASKAAGIAIANFGTYTLKESEVFGPEDS